MLAVILLYTRPRIAAEKSEVLDVYWMSIALVSDASAFGLMGIIIGAMLIAVLNATLGPVAVRQLSLAATAVE